MSRPTPVLVIFARAPALGMVKRRLAAGIGAAAARDFYVKTTRELLRRVTGDRRWRGMIAVTPDVAARRGRHWPGLLARLSQGPGDLGVRMERAMLRFPGRKVVLVGSDIPDLSADHIRAALGALGRAELVFGPARDGGYWLVGARDGRLAQGLFRGVRWSSPHALSDTLDNVSARRVEMLEMLDDIDDAADLERLSARP
ncbi:MAG: TIGR04282 family arsenosugar biosynthesis glycosyltransferase [Alphaproteobacteria bacterium]